MISLSLSVFPPPSLLILLSLSKVPALSSPASSTTSSSHVVGTRLPPNALKYFLRHLHNQLCRNDPEGVFSEPVTDEIAPGYSAIIKQPMDLQTMGHKVELNEYPSVSEFKVGFAEERVLLWSMCVCVCVLVIFQSFLRE